ncbi:MAG: glycosyltransferase family 39 protein [Candidatus Omnitrophica bacterium]|nr:glycosyltransferase family 39 protein [Candidatus Omnitrophota bacterium]
MMLKKYQESFNPKDIPPAYILRFFILISAVILRSWGLGFGLPNRSCRPDEELITDIAASFLNHFHPQTFFYPSFYKYLVMFFYLIYYGLGRICGQFSNYIGFLFTYAVKPQVFFLISRSISVVLGSASVYMVYLIARRLFKEKEALLSALYLAMAYLHVRDSHFGVTDVPATFFILVSIFFIIKAFNDYSLKNYSFAAIFAGLAASTKYSGALLIVPMFLAHFFNVFSSKAKIIKLVFDKKIILFVALMALFFIIGSPYVLLDFPQFKNDLLYEWRHLARGHGIMLGRGWFYHLKFSLFYGLGFSLFLSGLAGILVSLRQNPKKTLVLLSFPFAYFLLAGKGHTVFVRYSIPLVPFLCISAAVFSVFIINKFKTRTRILTGFCLVVFLLYPSVLNIIKFNILLSRPDNRLVTGQWVHMNIPQGNSIFQTGSEWGKVELWHKPNKNPRFFLWMKFKDRKKVLELIDNYRKDNNIIGYEQWDFDCKSKTFLYKGQNQKGLPGYIFVQRSPLQYSKVPQEIELLLIKHYTLLKSFEASDLSNKKNIYDRQDALFMPYAGFNKVKRPGPNFYIYKRI